MEILYEHTLQRQKALLSAKDRQIEQLTALVECRLSNNPVQLTNAGIIAIQGSHNRVAVDNSKNLTINIFGQENTDHITKDCVRKILDEALLAPELSTAVQTALTKIAMLIYSDPEHPENLTCYIPNKKSNDALIHSENGWELQPTAIVLPPIAKTSVDFLFEMQPHENPEAYGLLMKELANNEKRHSSGASMRTVLVRNKDLILNIFKKLPVAGSSNRDTLPSESVVVTS